MTEASGRRLSTEVPAAKVDELVLGRVGGERAVRARRGRRRHLLLDRRLLVLRVGKLLEQRLSGQKAVESAALETTSSSSRRQWVCAQWAGSSWQ